MSKSIPLSPKHGLNPCIPICFFCRETKNEIALLGKLKNDAEAPHSAFLDYEPCDTCKGKMAQGIALIGVTMHPNFSGQPAIAPDKYPTGNWLVVTDDFIKNNITPDIADDILKARKSLVDEAVLNNICDSVQ